MTAVMLDDEQAYHKAGRNRHQKQGEPVADAHEGVHGNPGAHKGNQCQDDFHNSLAVVGASVGCEFLNPCALGGSQNDALCKMNTTPV